MRALIEEMPKQRIMKEINMKETPQNTRDSIAWMRKTPQNTRAKSH